TPYQKQIWERFQIQASFSIAIMLDGKAWGLVVVHQCAVSRLWQESDVALISQLVLELTVRLQPLQLADALERKDNQAKLLTKISERIQRSRDENEIFRTTVIELRKFFNCDRAVVYRFYEDWSGEVVAESVNAGWVALMDEQERDTSIKDELMSSDRCSVKELGSPKKRDADTYLKESEGGIYNQGTRFRRVDDVNAAGFSACYLASLEKFQARAYVNVPLFQDGRLWGLVAIYQNSGPRRWLESECEAMVQVASSLGLALQQADTRAALEAIEQERAKASQREQAVTRLIERITQATDSVSIFRAATQSIRQLLECDRAVVYRFYEDWSGEVVAESVASGWMSIMDEQERDSTIKEELMTSDRCSVKQLGSPKKLDTDTYFKDTEGGDYVQGTRFKQIDDVYAAGFSPCYLQTLEKFQARAYINVPLYQGNRLWGLFVVYQNSGARTWTQDELDTMLQVSGPLSVALQKAEAFERLDAKSDEMARSADRERAITRIVEKVTQATDIISIFRTATQELRQLLECDRSVVYRFYEDWSGEVVAESVGTGWVSLMDEQERDASIKSDLMTSDRCSVKQLGSPEKPDADTYLKETKGGTYTQGTSCRQVDDVYEAGFSPCYLESLEKFQARAYINVPLFQGDRLWGLLCVYQNDAPRAWQQSDADALMQVSGPLSVALQRAEAIASLEAKSAEMEKAAERERTVSRIIERISEANEIGSLFRTGTQEIRQLLECDRVVVYRFYPDWSGEVVAESVATGWVSLMEEQNRDTSIKSNLMSSDRCTVKEYGQPANPDSDTYLKDNKGGMYNRGTRFRQVDDVHDAGFSPCYLESLEKFQARAY
ncbi:MAG: GAF domain-containing protein, partial [Cyanobacteria bacterium J06639_1]